MAQQGEDIIIPDAPAPAPQVNAGPDLHIPPHIQAFINMQIQAAVTAQINQGNGVIDQTANSIATAITNAFQAIPAPAPRSSLGSAPHYHPSRGHGEIHQGRE